MFQIKHNKFSNYVGKRIAVKINWPNIFILSSIAWSILLLLGLSDTTDSYSFNNGSPMDFKFLWFIYYPAKMLVSKGHQVTF